MPGTISHSEFDGLLNLLPKDVRNDPRMEATLLYFALIKHGNNTPEIIAGIT